MADESIIQRNLGKLVSTDPYDTFRRQRSYLENIMNREGYQDPVKRQSILKYFNLQDDTRPPDTSYEDDWQGSLSRAIDVGLEGGEQIIEGGRARLGDWLGDAEMVESARKNIQASELEASKISALQDRLNPNSKLGRFLFDASSSLPVTGVALAGSGLAAAALTTVGLPKLLAGFIGYGLVDALIESNANFADVLTHPRMMESLKTVLKRDPSDADLRNINNGVGRLLLDQAGQSANRTFIANLFNPTNILESKMKILGGKGMLGRIGRRSVVEGVEEGAQSVTSQFFREQAIGEVDPAQRRDVDKGQALYEGAIGAVSGPVISLPQTYLGLRADRRQEQAMQDLTDEMNAQLETERNLRERTTELVATKDLQGIDELILGNEDQAQKDIILGTVQELKGSEDAGIAGNARSYNRGTHVKQQEVAGDGQKEASTDDMDWQFREEYNEAKEAEALGTTTPRQDFIIRYAKHVKNPNLNTFLKSWGVHQRNMKDKNQPNQRMDTGQPTGQQQQPQQQPQPATAEQIQQTAQNIQQSLQQPAPPQPQVQQEAPPPIISAPESDSRSAFKELQKIFVFVLGAGNSKTQVNMAITEGLNKTDPSRTGEVPSQSTDPLKAGQPVKEKYYNGDTKKLAAKNALTKLIDSGIVTPEQGVQLTNIIDQTVLTAPTPTPTLTPEATAPPAPDQPTTAQSGTVADAFIDIVDARTGDYVSNMGRVMEPDTPMEAEDAVNVLVNIGMTDADIEKIMAPMEQGSTITVGELQATVDKMQAEMDRTEPPVQPQAEPVGRTITEQDARAEIRRVIEDTQSSSLLAPSIRQHVVVLMREDPTIDDKALLNSQMIDSQLDLFNANLINEYLSALKEIEGVDTNAIPEKYVNKYNIRKVLNKVFQSAGSAQSLRPTKLLNLGTAEESQARKEFYKGILTDPNFKGPDALDKSQLGKLEGGRAATDDKGMAFIDQSTEKVILQGGTIPEGTVIRVTTAGSKDRKGKMYRWTGRKPKAGDREPGMWYLVEFDGKDYRPVQDMGKIKTGETFSKDDDPFVRDDLWKETIRVNPDNKRGENITAAYLQLRDNPERLTVNQGKTVYQLPERGPGAEMPDPSGIGAVSGRLSDADKAMQNRIRDNNRTVSQFIQAKEAVNNNNTEKLSDLERANDELFEQNGFTIDSSFSDEGLTFVVSSQMNADPNFGALVKKLGFQELNRQPIGGAGDIMVTYGPPKPLKMPKFERDTTPQERDEYSVALEDALTNPVAYGQKTNKYSSLLKKRGSGKSTEKNDLQKAVDAMPDWLKNMIETNPKIAFLKKQEMIDLITTKTEKGNPAKDLTLPESLMPSDTDTDRVVDAKRKIVDAIWEASSTEYGTTNKGPGVRYSNLPKLWMVMSVLQNPGLASASIQKFLEFESASNMRNMSVDEMEIELMNLETMIETQLPNMRESLEEAVQSEMLATTELASIEADYDAIITDYRNSREDLENRAGELTPEEFNKQGEALRTKFIEDATNALDTLDTADATQAVKDSKTRVEELTREIAGLNSKFDTLTTQYQDAIQQAKENATQGLYAQKEEENAPEAAPVEEDAGRYAGIPTVDQDQINNSNAATLNVATGVLNKQIRTRMKASGVKGEKNFPKDKDLKVWFEEWLDANPGKILGKRKWRGDDKIYVANMTNNAGDVSQWVIDLSRQWIEQNGTIPIEAGKQRGEVGFDVTDVLGKDYKNPRQETGVNEFSDATIQTDQLGGQYNLSEGELGKLTEQLKQTELWSTSPEGVSIDNVVNSSDLDWTSPDADVDPRTLPDNHALKFFYNALKKSLVPEGQLKARATKMYNDMKDISYDYLKGLASYGYNSDTAVEEARNALSTGLINQSQYGAIDSIAVRNDKNMGKKKL